MGYGWVEVANGKRHRNYLAATLLIIGRYEGGRSPCQGTCTPEGPGISRTVVILQVPSIELAGVFYHPSLYREVELAV